MRVFCVLVVCTFAATVIHSCESKEHGAKVADFQNMHTMDGAEWKRLRENEAKVSAVSSEALLPGSNVNPEEIVQQAKIAAERAKTYPRSFKEWNAQIKRKMAAQKAGKKTTQEEDEVDSAQAHLQDREEMKVHATSPEPSMTMDEWKEKFDKARKYYLNMNKQGAEAAASPVKVYSESRKDLEQEIDEQVKTVSPGVRHRQPWVEKDVKEMKQDIKQQAEVADARPKTRPYHPFMDQESKEAVLQREREKIMRRYNEIKQNAMVFNHNDAEERFHQEAENRGYQWGK